MSVRSRKRKQAQLVCSTLRSCLSANFAKRDGITVRASQVSPGPLGRLQKLSQLDLPSPA